MGTRKTATSLRPPAGVQRPAARGAAGVPAAPSTEASFGEVVVLIHAARQRTAQAVNTALIDLDWRIGQFLHHRMEADGWAQGTVVQQAACIAQREPAACAASRHRTSGACGSSSRPVRRMRPTPNWWPSN